MKKALKQIKTELFHYVDGESDSGKVNNICISWLSEQGILGGRIKKRLKL